MKKIFLIIVPFLIFTACNEAVDEQAKMDENQQAIESYMLENNLTSSKDSLGMYMALSRINPSGQQPVLGDKVRVLFGVYSLDGLLTTPDSLLQRPVDLQYGYSLPGFDLGLSWMREGESGTLLIPYFLGYQSSGSADGRIPGYAPIRIDVSLLEVLSEDEQIEEYIARKGYEVSDETENGLRIVRLDSTSVDEPVIGNNQSVTVKYVGKFLSDAKFDEGEIQVLTGSQGSIAGFSNGISQLRRGEKAVLIFPSSLGYGERGQGTISPYSPLAFEVEVQE